MIDNYQKFLRRLEKESAVHEVAAQVGHTNINTTIIYTHPTFK